MLSRIMFKKMISLDQWKQSDILSLTKCMQTIAQLFGFWLFKIDFKKNVKYSNIDVKYYHWCLAVVATFTYLLSMYGHYITYADLEEIFKSEVFIETALNQTNVICSGTISILTIFMNIINRKILWKIVLTFFSFDEEVKRKTIFENIMTEMYSNFLSDEIVVSML